MKRKHFIFAAVATGTVICFATLILIVAATFTPTLEYDPREMSIPQGINATVLQVEEFLQRSGRLPPPRTGIVRRNGRLEWESMPESALQITGVTVSGVRLTSGASLLMSVLDDDPTYRAEIDPKVTTSDGRASILSVVLGDYGLLTPWSFHPRDDGWKPIGVNWN